MANKFSKIRCLVCNSLESPRQWLEKRMEGSPVIYMRSGGRGCIETVGFDKSPNAFPLVRDAVRERVLIGLRKWIKWNWISIKDDLFPLLKEYGYKVSQFSDIDMYMEEEKHPSLIRFSDAGKIDHEKEKFKW